MPKATRADVVECYRLFLNREPESDEVVHEQLDGEPELWQLIQSFENCPERRPPEAPDGSATLLPDARGIDVDVDSQRFTRLLAQVERVWSTLGTAEPYWSVLTFKEYLSSLIDDEGIVQFYQSGQDQVAFFEAVCARNGVAVDRSWRVLDLGCGVGRIGQYFAAAFRSYVGVDISTAHIEHARRHFADRQLKNAEFLPLPDFLSATPEFDLLFSVLCLQHNPPPIMLYLLNQSLARLAPGGYAFFQLPTYLYDYKFDVEDYLGRVETRQAMEMHALPQIHVFKALAANGLVPIEVFPWQCIGPIGLSYAFFAQKVS